MGTRADFYVRGARGEMEWLGSVARAGNFWAAVERNKIREARDESGYRAAVHWQLRSCSDSIMPSCAWPWPWPDSHTTDYAYVFDGDKGLRIFRFGREIREDRSAPRSGMAFRRWPSRCKSASQPT